MAWESRRRGGRYYTRSKRRNGRIVRTYFGNGELAEMVAAFDASDREEREAALAAREAERRGPLAIEQALALLGRELDALVHTTLEAAGYHAHRGCWRRKRSDRTEPRGRGNG